MPITIGITAYNEEKNIGKLLEILTKERFSFKLKEIIVVASGCIDRTVDIIKRFRKRNKKIKLIIEKNRRGKVSAVNQILKKSRGEIIVFICADNLPKNDSVNKLIENFCKEKIGSVSGRPIPLENKDTIFGYISHLIWNLHHEICLKNPKISGELFALRKGIIKKIPYNIINDDGYIEAITRKRGYKIIYSPKAITFAAGKNNFLSHIRRRSRIARGYIQLKKLGFNVNIPPILIFKAFIKKVKIEPSIFKTLIAAFMEILANILAYYNTLRKRTPYCWEK